MNQLRGIIRELQQQRARIDAALKVLRPLSTRKGRRTMSAAGRRRIAAAQRARWARWRKGKKK